MTLLPALRFTLRDTHNTLFHSADTLSLDTYDGYAITPLHIAATIYWLPLLAGERLPLRATFHYFRH